MYKNNKYRDKVEYIPGMEVFNNLKIDQFNPPYEYTKLEKHHHQQNVNTSIDAEKSILTKSNPYSHTELGIKEIEE